MSKKDGFSWGTAFAGVAAYKASSTNKKIKGLEAKEKERERKQAYQEQQHEKLYKLHQDLEKLLKLKSLEERVEKLDFFLCKDINKIDMSVVKDIGYKDRYHEMKKSAKAELSKAREELTQRQIETLELKIKNIVMQDKPVMFYQNLKKIEETLLQINLQYLSDNKYKTRYQDAEKQISLKYKKVKEELGQERWRCITELENSLPKLGKLLLQKKYKKQYTEFISSVVALCAIIRQAHEVIPEYLDETLEDKLLRADKFILEYQDKVAMLKCMILLTKCDGEATAKQTKQILKFCKKISLNNDDLNIVSPDANNFSFSEELPEKEKISFLLNLKKSMQPSRETSSLELEFFSNTCKTLGIDEKKLPQGVSAMWFKLKSFFAKPNEKVNAPKPSLKIADSESKKSVDKTEISKNKKDDSNSKDVLSGCLILIVLVVIIGGCMSTCGKNDKTAESKKNNEIKNKSNSNELVHSQQNKTNILDEAHKQNLRKRLSSIKKAEKTVMEHRANIAKAIGETTKLKGILFLVVHMKKMYGVGVKNMKKANDNVQNSYPAEMRKKIKNIYSNCQKVYELRQEEMDNLFEYFQTKNKNKLTKKKEIEKEIFSIKYQTANMMTQLEKLLK